MTLGGFLSNCDVGDPIAFVIYYIPSMFVGIFVGVITGVTLYKRRVLNRKNCFVLFGSIISVWGIYFISTASQNMTLALLGSESSGAAEYAYRSFNINLHQAIVLTTNNRFYPWEDAVGRENARFYAACRIADMLASSNQDFQNTILGQVQSAPEVTPGFIGTNSINFNFYVDGREQPVLPVSEIIRRRLAELDKR